MPLTLWQPAAAFRSTPGLPASPVEIEPISPRPARNHQERRRSESNRRIEVLQTSALPLGYGAVGLETGWSRALSQPTPQREPPDRTDSAGPFVRAFHPTSPCTLVVEPPASVKGWVVLHRSAPTGTTDCGALFSLSGSARNTRSRPVTRHRLTGSRAAPITSPLVPVAHPLGARTVTQALATSGTPARTERPADSCARLHPTPGAKIHTASGWRG